MPAFYGYRMRFRDPAGEARQTVGVIGALELEPPGSGILPHEQTTPKAKTDRLELLRATRANLSPIWGLTPAGGLAACCPPPGHPAEHAVDLDGVHARVVAHHRPRAGQDRPGRWSRPSRSLSRTGTTATKRRSPTRRNGAQNGAGGADDDAVMALIVELAEEQLTVQAIHRLHRGPPGRVRPAGRVGGVVRR